MIRTEELWRFCAMNRGTPPRDVFGPVTPPSSVLMGEANDCRSSVPADSGKRQRKVLTDSASSRSVFLPVLRLLSLRQRSRLLKCTNILCILCVTYKWLSEEIQQGLSKTNRDSAIKIRRFKTMRQLNPEKLANLPTFNRQLDEEYGKPGTAAREGFHEEALSWYYGQLLSAYSSSPHLQMC